MRVLSRVKKNLSKAVDVLRLLRYYQKPFGAESLNIELMALPEASLDLVVVAFNRPDMIEYQHLFLQKNFINAFRYTVADNSNTPEARTALRQYCKQHNLPYLSLPVNPFKAPRFSDSHGAALNYVWQNYLKPRGASRMGILDHDIFPIQPFELNNILDKQDFYGMLQEYENPNLKAGKLFYLWPGLAFFNCIRLTNTNVDFLPKHNADTGAAMHSMYAKAIEASRDAGKTLEFADEERIPLLAGDDFQNSMYALVGKKWLHVVNASQWKMGSEEKEDRIKRLINQLLEGAAIRPSNF